MKKIITSLMFIALLTMSIAFAAIELTDEEIRNQINEYSYAEQIVASKLSDSKIKAIALEKTDYNEETIERAIEIFREEYFNNDKEDEEVELEYDEIPSDPEDREDLSDKKPRLAEANKVLKQAKVKGLENALLRVKNENAIKQLERNLEKIQEKEKSKLNMVELVIDEEDDGDVIASGKKEAKFLGIFKLKHQYKYDVDVDGKLTRIKQPFDDLWQDGADV